MCGASFHTTAVKYGDRVSESISSGPAANEKRRHRTAYGEGGQRFTHLDAGARVKRSTEGSSGQGVVWSLRQHLDEHEQAHKMRCEPRG